MRYLSIVGPFIVGATAATVSVITIYDRVFTQPLSNVDDVVTSLNRISIALESGNLKIAPSELEQVNAALTQVSGDAYRASTGNDPAQTSYLRVSGGAFELPVRSSVDLDAPNGEFASFGLERFFGGSVEGAIVHLNGEEKNLRAGQTLQFPSTSVNCNILYIGPANEEYSAARFRFRCNMPDA
ncbi:hypothetical protein [Sagittula sp. MA-2]|uniref:hypothetical protein n=1 Tax=Sagittula sp. MA-2 TaxID=3048007 RepID=UPI0024C3B5C4|nr:hypothetical protein [Sagittula sp. MA-2]WHZ37744.1 hypothetical protein QNI11_22760 [Sagittula sp. MA-2]